MDIQNAPPPGAMAPNQAVAGMPPRLGTPIPGTTGGLPAQGGLSVLGNPMAQQLQSQGRGEDSMLVHMTPNEVNSLQGLAMAHGGSLTINPHTGLPEAGWLGKLLPSILGAALAATGVGAPLAAGLVGLGTGIAKGSLKEGLMAGLGAFGGAGMAGMAGLGGAITNNAFGALGNSAGMFGANMGAGLGAAAGNAGAVANTANAAKDVGLNAAKTAQAAQAATPSAGAVSKIGSMANAGKTIPQGPGLLGRFNSTIRQGLPEGTPGFISKNAPMLAGMGVLSSVSNAMTPTVKPTVETPDTSYKGPYNYAPREYVPLEQSPIETRDSSEHLYFSPVRPQLLDVSGKPAQFAGGGDVNMDNGSFVLDARTVSEIGNGSSNAGIEALRRLGGHPVQGPGDGVSDSVPARIGGTQAARVARDEVIMPAAAVRRIGGGDPKRGADKLYAMMDRAHKARKRAGRGTDTKLRSGLA